MCYPQLPSILAPWPLGARFDHTSNIQCTSIQTTITYQDTKALQPRDEDSRIDLEFEPARVQDLAAAKSLKLCGMGRTSGYRAVQLVSA